MTGKRIAQTLGLGFLSILALDLALKLVSSRSNIGVLVGVAILGGLAVIYVPLIAKGVRKVVEALDDSGLSIVLPVLIFIGLMSSGCSKMISPGHVGIVVNQYGSEKGVQDYTAETGMIWYNPITTSVFEYPTYVQTAVWTRSPTEGSPNNEEISFNTKEGMIITGDISLSYQLDAGKVPHFYVKFRSDDLNTFTHGFLRNIARDAFNELGPHYSVEEVYGEKKEELIKLAKERINTQIEPIGVHLEQFGFVGAPRLPEPVVEALNAKIKATQDAMRVQNELMQTQAEAQKVVAKAEGEAKARVAQAEGEARANQALTSSITPQLLQWKELEITQSAVTKWNGQRPMVEGNASGLLLSVGPFDHRGGQQ